jgi:predicted ATPase/class 3 adenylate cyclase/DNA-binding XRE family transcriptional regulator
LQEVSFGEWLKRRRKALDLTQEQLAQRINCSTSALRKIEAEERRPSAQIVEQLAAVFNIPSSERAKFLKFARGQMEAAPAGGIVDTPWRVSKLSEREDLSKPGIHLATFLFTDIEDSTKLWESAPEQMKVALQRHHAILDEAISSNGGEVFQIVGDAFCAAFPTAPTAISAAVKAQCELYKESWNLPFPIRVRMSIHTGEAERTSRDALSGGYVSNQTLNRVTRILKAGHGGQVLLSFATKVLTEDSLPMTIGLRDMGEHSLKSLIQPEHLFQLTIEGLPSKFPPLKTFTIHRHNLPIQLTSFIGREKEIRAVQQKLDRHRLVTLTGSGGTGKTRLSLQVAAELLELFPDGIWFIELAPITDPDLIPQTIHVTMGLVEQPDKSILQMLIEFLRDKKILIILDNCEHLIEACAVLTFNLLSHSPALKILASSREALGVQGELAWRVPSLSLPDPKKITGPDQLTQYEAVRLFIDRASLANPRFEVTQDNGPVIAEICQRLDGIPLALELAAARVKVLSVNKILERLNDCFRLLAGGNRTALPRHQTLQAAIDWSYDLLNDQERTLFRRLAVFVGGWTLEAAEAIGRGGIVAEHNVVDLLINLVEKSLITANMEGERYGMLETVRQYAEEKMFANGEAETCHQAHLEYFLKLSEEAEPHLKGAGQMQWFKRLEVELDNLRMALDRSLSSSADREAGLKLSAGIWRFWQRSMHASEGRMYLARLLEQVPREEARETFAYAKALTAAGALAYFQSDYPSAEVSRQKALDVFRKLRDVSGIADSLHGLGNIALSEGNYETARSMYEECLAIRQKLGQREQLSGTLSNLGLIAYNEGDYSTARSLEMESCSIFQEFGNKAGMGFALNLLGNIARNQGDLPAARKYHEESIALCTEAADQWGVANALNGLAEVALAEGDVAAAYSLCQDCLNLLREGGAKEGMAYCLETIAAIALAKGQPNRGVRLFGAAAALRKSIKLPLTPTDRAVYEANMAEIHRQIDDMAFNVAWEEGQMMLFDRVIQYALSETLNVTKGDQ